MKSGWLLIPAAFFGLLGVILAVRGVSGAKEAPNQMIPGMAILLGGVVLFFILLAVTSIFFKRQPTSELPLIVGWSMLALAEINVLHGCGSFSFGLSVKFAALILAALIISIVCYVVYYRMDKLAGYIDGAIPLLLAALIMAGISYFMARPFSG
jgi:drug/metabolite transporter (DMT)-like permease